MAEGVGFEPTCPRGKRFSRLSPKSDITSPPIRRSIIRRNRSSMRKQFLNINNIFYYLFHNYIFDIKFVNFRRLICHLSKWELYDLSLMSRIVQKRHNDGIYIRLFHIWKISSYLKPCLVLLCTRNSIYHGHCKRFRSCFSVYL